jgi:hypothetical protein
LKFARHRCRQLIGTIEKIVLAANNGDTLVEAVISVKRNKFRLGQQRKFQLKNNNQKIVQTSSFTIFSSDVLKDEKLITVLRSASHDINDKIFNTVGMATAASRRP